MNLLVRGAALALVVLGFAVENASAQRINWSWEYDYQLYAVPPTPETAFMVEYRPRGSNEAWREYAWYEDEVDAAWRVLRLDNAGYEARIVEISPEPEWELIDTFDTFSQAADAAQELEELLDWDTKIVSIMVPKEQSQVDPGSRIERPSKRELAPQRPFPLRGF